METSLIRVCDAGGETHGTGFVLSDSLAVTCAHVVEDCGAGPSGRVVVVFHVDGDRREAEVLAEFWRASDSDDIAVLRFESGMPHNVTPVRLGRTSGTDGHRCATLGYPHVGALQGVEGRGEIYRSVSEANGRQLIQLTSKEITAGFSGAPLLDQVTGRVVGMITQIAEPDRYGRMGETAFATPADVLYQLMLPLCPDLRQHLPQAVEDYLRAVAQFCHDLPYVSLKSDVPLETVYVRQQMRQEPQEGRRTNDEATVRQELAEREMRARPMTVTQALEEHRRVMVVGGPGTGKSTLLRHVVQGVAEGTSDWHPHLPILVSLRGLAEQRGDLTTSLREEVRAELGPRLLTSLPENFLTDWPCQTDLPWLIALDGLDEIVDEGDRRALIRQLKQTAWPTGSRVLITTRPDTSAGLEGFTAFDLLPFEPQQVEEFAHNWFRPDEARARAFLDSLHAARMGDLSGTPLLLTVAATVFEQSPDVSHLRGLRRSRLYGEFVRILLAEDAAPNRRMREQFCQQFRTDPGERLFEYRREVLESIALALQEGRAVRDTLVESLKQVVGWSDQDAARKADNVLKILVQRRAGLVVQRGDRFEFIHPSFREYLAAAALVQASGSDLKKVWERAVWRWREWDWREVALFVLGLLSDSDQEVTPLLEQICKERGPHQLEEIWKEGGLYFAGVALAEQVRVADHLASQIIWVLVATARKMSRDWKSGGEALIILGQLRAYPRVAKDLLALARDKTVDAYTRAHAAEALGKWGRMEEAASILFALARDERIEAEQRVEAAEVLGRLGRAEDLLALARDETMSVGVRVTAATGLGRLGRAEDLLALARDETIEAWMRVNAAEALGKYVRSAEAGFVLLAFTRDKTLRAGIHLTASEALAELGWTDEAVPVLLALARDETMEAWVRWQATKTLGRFGDASLLPDLGRIAQHDANINARRAAQEAVEQIRRRMSGE